MAYARFDARGGLWLVYGGNTRLYFVEGHSPGPAPIIYNPQRKHIDPNGRLGRPILATIRAVVDAPQR